MSADAVGLARNLRATLPYAQISLLDSDIAPPPEIAAVLEKEQEEREALKRRREFERITAERDFLIRERDRARNYYENEGW